MQLRMFAVLVLVIFNNAYGLQVGNKVSGLVKTKNSQNFGVIFRSCSPPASFGRLAT